MGVTTPLANTKIPRDLAPYQGRGRPSKLTPDRHLKIVEQVRKGVPVEVAAGSTGVSREAFYLWLSRGKEDESKGVTSPYVEFMHAVLKARDDLEAELAAKWVKIATEPTEKVKTVYKEQVVVKQDGTYEVVRYLDSETTEVVGDGDWRGVAEFMLRRYADRWNRREGLDVDAKVDVDVSGRVEHTGLPASIRDMSPEGKRAFIELLERERVLRLGEGGGSGHGDGSSTDQIIEADFHLSDADGTNNLDIDTPDDPPAIRIVEMPDGYRDDGEGEGDDL